MTQWEGLDQVDPSSLESQYELTRELWKSLKKNGVRHKSIGRIEAYFYADTEEKARSLARAWADDYDDVEVSTCEGGEFSIRVVTDEAYLSHSAFRELMEISMISAHENHCRFDGFQVDIAAVKKRPWWVLW